MSVMKQIAIIGLLVFCTLAGTAVGYFIAARQANLDQLNQFYLSSAMSARSTAFALTQLRSAGADKATRVLENQLSIDLITLGFYENNVPPAQRLGQIYANVAKVREYYQRFPAARPSPFVADGLALVRSPPAP